ncbi:MAG: nucleoside deaminase [Gammaproteobacteria bacterium]
MSDHQDYLRQAIQLAVDNVAACGGGPYGAVIVKEGAVIAAAANRVTADRDPTAHAEIVAIRQACAKLHDFQLKDCILYSSCEPCPMCLGAIYWARLTKVYYACSRDAAALAGFDDRFIYDEIGIAPAARRIPMLYLQCADADKPFIAWNQQSDKLSY